MDNKENKYYKIFLSGRRPILWICLFIFFVYGMTLFSNIVYLDDNVLVTGQYQFNKNLSNIPQAFKEDIFQTPLGRGTFYRPIERISFIFDAQFGEGSVVFMSHLTNLLLHMLSICLLFYLLIKLDIDRTKAFLFSLIFGIHPLTAQTVAFISGRNDSLLAIFVFPSFIYLLSYLQTKKSKYLVWNLVFLALSLFTKETAAVLPGIFIIYILIFIGYKKIITDYKLYIRLITSWIGVGLFWFIARIMVLHNIIGNAPYNILLSIYKNLISLIPAIGKVFLPFSLSVFPVMKDMTLLYGLISFLILGVWFILSEKKNYKFIIFGFLWFFIFIILTLIKPLGTVPEFSENRIYIPMFGFIFVILGLGMIRLPSFIKDNINYEVNYKKLIIILSLIIILIFSCVTIYRNKYYLNKLNFWENATATSPSFAFNHNNLGAMRYLDGDMDNAEKEYKMALNLNPNEPMAHGNLGLIYFKEDKLDDALSEYKREISVNPNYDNVYFNLGLLYYKLERYEDAVDNWKKTLIINPNHLDALRALTSYYYNNKNYEEALTYGDLLYRMGFELPPDLLRMIKLGGIN